MKIVAFCGPSDSGKTWTIERIVRLWAARGLRVGVVKHCSKGFQLDPDGKDSARFWRGGAEAVAVVGPDEWAVRHREPAGNPIRIIAEAFPDGLDVAILEGFREVAVPRVRVLGHSEDLGSLVAEPVPIAIVSREPVRGRAPAFLLDDAEGLAAFLSKALGLPADRHFAPAIVPRHARA